MAVVQNPLIGSAKNKIGGTVFQKWKNKNVLRTKPLTVANPRTLAQQKQRVKMSVLVSMMRLFLPTLKEAFNEVIAAITAPNAFISANMPAITVNDSLEPTIDYTAMILSKGTVWGMIGSSVSDDGLASFTCDFVVNSNGTTALDTDQIRLGFICPSKAFAQVYSSVGQRNNGSNTPIDFTGILEVGDTVHVYGYFVRPSVNKESDSVYIDTVVITA